MAHVSTPFVGDVVQSSGDATTFTMPAERSLSGHKSWVESLADADTAYYIARHTAKPEWEFGLGTWAETARTLTRTTVLRGSNSTTKVDFSDGNVEVVLARAGDIAHLADYTVTNLTPTRSISGTESTAANIAAVVATLVNDLITAGVLK